MTASTANSPAAALGRRRLMGAGAALAAAGVAAVAAPALAAPDERAVKDVAVLNVALGLEHELIAAYQASLDHAGLVSPVRDIALLFQGHHREHARVLTEAIRARGGGPVPSLAVEEYAAAWPNGLPTTDEAALSLVADRERAAADGFVRLTGSLHDRALAETASRLVADEVMHWTALSGALQRELPMAALTFGG